MLYIGIRCLFILQVKVWTFWTAFIQLLPSPIQFYFRPKAIFTFMKMKLIMTEALEAQLFDVCSPRLRGMPSQSSFSLK